ncbi:MAG: N-acetylmuramoyl-L-alanine amidase [Chlamydiales bacterium]|nr:N-acetylmuramoyl-L-alanine amidase [Chlamydiales bacterium]
MRKWTNFFCTALLLLFVGCSHVSQNDTMAEYQISRSKKAKTSIPNPKKQQCSIVIDPGHGAFDFGTHSKVCCEKNANLTTALLLEKYLYELGYRVTLTRYDDTFVTLKDRAKFANMSNASLFVSVHYNAAKNTSAHGIEVYYYPDSQDKNRVAKSKCLAQYVLAKMLAITGATSRGIKPGNFGVIRETQMPAILVEGGFITNPKEAKLLGDRKYLDKLAFAISEGIDRFIMEDRL